MGFGMAQSLMRAGLAVKGYDAEALNVTRFTGEGGTAAASPAEAAAGAAVIICAVVNAVQTEAVMFGSDGAGETAAKDAVFVSCATMDPAAAKRLGERWEAEGRLYLDAPMSGGPARAAKGELTFMASGPAAAFVRAPHPA